MGATPASVTGAASDLVLTPALGWGGLGTSAINIGENGVLTPAGAALGSYLYGAQWNTQFRRPPTFQTNYPQAGIFSVSTGQSTGTSPKIAIYLDDKLMLETVAAINQTYSINVPSGMHRIRVDNTGTDWITIKSYTFSGLGSAIDTYVLKSKDNSMLAAWVLNHAYNHSTVKAKGLPTPINGAMLQVEAIQNGAYQASWYHCLTGALVKETPVVVTSGQLNLAIPELAWDLALILQPQQVAVAERILDFPFNLYPNPVLTGTIQLSFELQSSAPVQITLLDASGRTLHQLLQQPLPAGNHQQELQIPSELPRGIYWVQVRAGQAVGVKPIISASGAE